MKQQQQTTQASPLNVKATAKPLGMNTQALNQNNPQGIIAGLGIKGQVAGTSSKDVTGALQTSQAVIQQMGYGAINKRIMFKNQNDSGSITGVKADEKFSVEGQNAYTQQNSLKEKNITELAQQQQQEAQANISQLIAGEKISSDPYQFQFGGSKQGASLVRNSSSENKYSPFRSQRNVGSISQQTTTIKTGAPKCVKLIKPDPNMIRRLLTEEKDERYRYLLRHGNILNVEQETLTLYVELPQIPNIVIIYRRPSEREQNVEKMTLDSRNLKHIPLLEGEEKIKYLNLQNNEIQKIENLVSLPNLTFLDLQSNKLKEIQNFATVENLRVLMLSKNLLESIKNVDNFKHLDILDLHENKITKIENICKLTSLRVLNLSHNLIEVVENLGGMKSLVELNLRKNKINNIKELQCLNSLQKLYLSHNTISSLENVNDLPSLTDLTIENNPIEKQPKFANQIREKFSSLQNLNLQKIANLCEEDESKLSSVPLEQIQPVQPVNNTISHEKQQSIVSSQQQDKKNNSVDYSNKQPIVPGHVQTTTTQPAQTNKQKTEQSSVIKIIQREWEKECERLDAKKNGYKPKQNLGDKSLVQSGHAEIEANKILYIYGNALEVLQRSEFYDQVEEMHLQYVRFDLIVYHANLDKLKRFTKLKKLYLANNYLNSFILLSKIECLNSLNSLTITENEILDCKSLKSFIVYRFQHIQEFNGPMINDQDKKIAKQQFQLFDKILSIQNVFTRKGIANADPTKRQEQRLKSKKNGEMAHLYVMGIIEECNKKEDDKFEIDGKLENIFKNIIYATTIELMGEPISMEKKMKKAII